MNEDDNFYPLENAYDLDYYFQGTLESRDAVIYPYVHKENKLYFCFE